MNKKQFEKMKQEFVTYPSTVTYMTFIVNLNREVEDLKKRVAKLEVESNEA
jgi:hypothetical protein